MTAVPDGTSPGATRGAMLAAFAAVYLVWGSTYLAIRIAVETLPPFTMLGVRFALAGLVMVAWARLRGAPAPTLAHWRWALFLGLLIPCWGTGSVAWAEQTLTSGTAALLAATVPLWIGIFDALAGGGLGGRAWVGFAIGFAGVGVLVGPEAVAGLAGGGDATPGAGGAAIAAAVLVIGAAAWAGGSVLSRRAALPDSPILSTGIQLVAGGGLLLLLGQAFGEGARTDLSAVSTASLVAWLYLLIFGTFVAFTAYHWLLRVVSPSRAGTYAFVNPVVALVLAWSLGDELFAPRVLGAAGLILASVVMILTAPGRRPRRRAPLAARPVPAETVAASAGCPPAPAVVVSAERAPTTVVGLTACPGSPPPARPSTYRSAPRR